MRVRKAVALEAIGALGRLAGPSFCFVAVLAAVVTVPVNAQTGLRDAKTDATTDATSNASTTALPHDTPEPLRFADFYKRPIGPRGLEPGARLMALAGSRVVLAGFVARGGEARRDLAILVPTPVLLDDEDESLADDLPAAVAYLHFDDGALGSRLSACRGAVRVTGRLELGRLAEPDGRMSFVRVHADDAQCVR